MQDYQSEMTLAASAGIDGFAVNMGANDPSSNLDRVSDLFDAAEQSDFKIMFSFDYEGNGVWAQSTVLEFLNEVRPIPHSPYPGRVTATVSSWETISSSLS